MSDKNNKPILDGRRQPREVIDALTPPTKAWVGAFEALSEASEALEQLIEEDERPEFKARWARSLKHVDHALHDIGIGYDKPDMTYKEP